MNVFTADFKAKFMALRLLRFDPFVLQMTIVAWPHSSEDNFSFFKKTQPPSLNPRQKEFNFSEHIIIECATERKAIQLKNHITSGRSAIGQTLAENCSKFDI